MRTPDDVRCGWDALFKDPLLSKDTVKSRGLSGRIGQNDLRSLYWKIYLEYLPSLSSDSWSLILAKERQGYEDLKKKYIFNPNKASEEANDWTLNNPLSLSEDSPWTQYFKDVELQKVIRQDVERTFPDQQMFRSREIQDVMTDILFVWCKLNPDISYRQGMHELLAPVLFVVEFDKLDPSSSAEGLPAVAQAVFDPKYVEHDSAVLFYRIMRSTKPWFEVGEDMAVSRPQRGVKGSKYQEHRETAENLKPVPIIIVCRRVQNELLRVLDYELHQHLSKHGIEPQLYGLRWLRLLFGREFPIPELFTLWDGIFAEDPNLGLVEWVCIALLMFLRKDLVGNDYAMTMHRLMKFPPMQQLGTTVPSFIDSARGLRERYTQRALLLASSNNQRTPQQPAVAVTRVESPQRMKRSNVPWLHHTDEGAAKPQAPVPAQPERRTSGPQRPYPPIDGFSVPRRDSPSRSSIASIPSSSSSLPSPVDQHPSAHGQHVDPVQLQLAHLTKQIQHVRERDRTLVKKLDRCVSLIKDLVGTDGSKGDGNRFTNELEGVMAELTTVANELRPVLPTLGSDFEERHSPAKLVTSKSKSSPSLPSPTRTIPSRRESTPVTPSPTISAPINAPNTATSPAVTPTTAPPEATKAPIPRKPQALEANDTPAVLPVKSVQEEPVEVVQADAGEAKLNGEQITTEAPARWGSNSTIRHSPPVPTDHEQVPPPAKPSIPKSAATNTQPSASASQPRQPAAPRARSTTPDPWQSDASGKSGEAAVAEQHLVEVFEDPWADHGQGAEIAYGGSGSQQLGSSEEIRNRPEDADVDDADLEGMLSRPPAGTARVEASRPSAAPSKSSVPAVAPLTPGRIDLSNKDPLGAAPRAGVTLSPRSVVTADPLGNL
ncbi:TBC1 domain, member 5 [Rhizophlyctis rosea]|nr:TBC1 domain, member 5 [Rhizophlyctis rosea]